MNDFLIKTIREAEDIRAHSTDTTTDPEKTKQILFEAIQKLETIIEKYNSGSLNNTDPLTKIGVGQTEFSIATIYASLAKFGARDNDEKDKFLRLAEDHLNSKLLKESLPEMEKGNKSITNDPVLWKAEILRIHARIEERRPNQIKEDLGIAFKYYSEAIDYSYKMFLQATKEKNHPLQLASLSAYTTALEERARIRPENEKEFAMLETATITGLLFGIYDDLPNYDRLETILARTIQVSLNNQTNIENPLFRQTIILYILLLNKNNDRSRLKKRIEQLQNSGLNIPEDLLNILNSAVTD